MGVLVIDKVFCCFNNFEPLIVETNENGKEADFIKDE
jgi:hypothetical protein